MSQISELLSLCLVGFLDLVEVGLQFRQPGLVCRVGNITVGLQVCHLLGKRCIDLPLLIKFAAQTLDLFILFDNLAGKDLALLLEPM